MPTARAAPHPREVVQRSQIGSDDNFSADEKLAHEIRSDGSTRSQWGYNMRLMLVTVLGLACIPCAAYAGETSPATMALARSTLDQSSLETSTGRQALARAVRNYCAEVGRVYPQNSPAEDRWLEGELRGDSKRTKRALESAELGRRQAKNFTEACAISSAAFDKEPDRPRNYVALAYYFARFSTDAEYFAQMNSVDTDRLGLNFALRPTIESLLLAALLAEQ